MNAIVMNTLTAAVTEYDWAFQSITPTHAGDATGLYELGGETDNTQPIVAKIMTGKTLCGTTLKKRIDLALLSVIGSGSGIFYVGTEQENFQYTLAVRPTGQSRCAPGKGIRANFMAFGYGNSAAGEAFSLERIEVLNTISTTRRT